MSAADLGDAMPTVTIESVSVFEGKDKTTQEPYKQLCLHFVGKTKKLSLNFTNAQRVAKLTGSDDSDDWIGKTIRLFTEPTSNGKQGVRISPELPPQNAQTAPAQPMTGTPEDDSIPW